MSSENTPGVSAPGMPENVTVQETSAQPKAPAVNGFRSDTTGMSESQTAALAFVDANRAAAMRADDPFLQRKVNQALAHAFGGGPAPEFLAQREQARADAAKNDQRPVGEGDAVSVGAELDAITESDLQGIASRGVVSGQLPPDIAQEAASFCLAAQLPKIVSNVVVDRLAKHVRDGWGPGEMSDAELAELHEECVRAFGGEDKATAEAELARKYLHSAGGDALLAQADKIGGSLMYDPRVILQLSYLARAKGLA